MLEGNSKFSKGYICSTAISTSPNLRKIITKPLIYLLHDTWDNLSDKFFKDIQAIEKGKAIKPTKPLSPRPHQKKALKDAVKHFEKENEERGKLIFPCGAGKSLTGFWMTQQLKSKATLIAVPSLSLVKQTLEVYLQEIHAHGKTVKWLCICSDDGIGKTDDVVYYTEDLGVPCETDPEFIEQWLKENQDDDLVVFTTYQSGRIIADISQKLDFIFDVGIYDEAHKTVGSNKKLFSHLLFEENISVKKRIFMTATERFYGGSKDDIISMDDEDIYGDTFTQMSFKEAIESNLLTDYKVITIDVKKSEISEFIRTNNLIQLNDKWKKETEARSLASMLALRKAMKKFDIKNAVSFHSSIEKAVRNKELQKHITDTYNFQPIDTFTVSGKQGTTKRNQIVKEFAESSKALITNAKCLTEGVDVPNIDCIVFSDPKRSKVDIVQALGRALRKKDGKEWGYVVLPVIYDEKTNEIDNDNFDEILAIVRGLASNDERIVEYFRDKNQKENTGTREGSPFQLDVVSDYMDEEELTKQLEIRLWEKLSRFNWMPFEEAREYVRRLRLTGQKEWRNYTKSKKRNPNIPSEPFSIYKNNGWLSIGDWLGTTPGWDGKFLSLPIARKFVHKLKLKNGDEWKDYCATGKKPFNIPAKPRSAYLHSGWISIGDWLGTGTVADKNKVFRNFNEARRFVHKLNLTSETEWRKYNKSGNKPIDIPSSPQAKYKDTGWVSWGDWLGTNSVATQKINYLDFVEAREFIRQLNMTTTKEWKEYSKKNRPINLPAHPYKEYENKGWLSMPDWLGVKPGWDGSYLSLEDAKTKIRELGVKSKSQFEKLIKSGDIPYNIKHSPRTGYKNEGWKDWSDFLESVNISRHNSDFLPFDEAREYTRTLKLNSRTDWKRFTQSDEFPSNMPKAPWLKYKDEGWISLGDWLGSGNIATQKREYMDFKSAKSFVYKLKLSSESEWRKYCKSGKRPANIPTGPDKKYKDEWKGWPDFLGKE